MGINPYPIVLELALTFIVGLGKAFVRDHSNSLKDGMFLLTTNHHDGTPGEYHCWRIANIHSDYFQVVEPDKSTPAQCIQWHWDYLEMRGCIAIVCVP